LHDYSRDHQRQWRQNGQEMAINLRGKQKPTASSNYAEKKKKTQQCVGKRSKYQPWQKGEKERPDDSNEYFE
jgi:hypothetical protein